MRYPWLGVMLAGCMAAAGAEAPSPQAPKPSGGKPAGGAVELEERPEPLVPARPKTDADRDRIEAMSLFAAGRTEEQAENLPAALRLYQRALRYDPKALPIYQQIIDVALKLGRKAEMVRYALQALDIGPLEPHVLDEIREQTTQSGDFDGALKVCQKARLLAAENKKTPQYLALTLTVGQLHLVAAQPREAADAFAEVIQGLNHPDDYGLTPKTRRALLRDEHRGWLMFAGAFLQADRPAEARAAFAQAHKLALPSAAVEAFHEAQALAVEKKPAEALQKLQVYLDARESSEGAVPYELLKDVLQQLDRGGELAGMLERARAADQGNTALAGFLAAEYRAAEKWNLAEPILQELLKQSAKGDAYRGLIEVYRATKQPDKLLKILAEVTGRINSLEPLKSEVRAIAENGELVTGLVESARAAARQAGPDARPDYGTSLALGLVLLEAKRYDAAGEFLEAAIAARKDRQAEILLVWGLELLTGEQYPVAARVFQRAVDEKVGPADNPGFLFYLGTALELDGKTDEALKAARAAAALGSNPRIESRAAWIEYHAKRYSDAARSYRQLIAKYGNDYQSDETRKVLREARLTLSNIAVIENNLPQAEEWLEQVLDEFPEDVSALNDLGYLWADQGKHLDRALEMIRAAVAAEPDNAAYQDSLGWALYRLGRYDEALEAMKKAAAGAEVDGVIYDHLGDVYHARGDKAQARKAWQQALEALRKSGDKEKLPSIEAKLAK